ncbi:hypothetical protein ACSBR1_019656 [Camellia fascicularis]
MHACRQLLLYPKGNGAAKGQSLSVYLQLADWETFSSEQKVYAEYKLVIRDQVQSNHFYKEVLKYWFSPSNINYGYRDFLSLSDLNNTSKGFLVNDAVIVEAEIKL